MTQQNKEKKLTDEAFSRLMITAIAGILLCMICLCSTTYAWFTASIPNTGNELKAAGECLLAIEVSRDGVALEATEGGVELEAGADGEEIAYTVTLTLPQGSASGYCLVTAGGSSYCTAYIARHSEPEPVKTSFTVVVGSTQTVVFTPKWGIYAQESDVKDGVLFIP